MATPIWKPGTLYNPGAIVQRASAPPILSPTPLNANFESGDTGWTKGAGWTIAQKGGDSHAAFDGNWAGVHTGITVGVRITNNERVPILPGRSITARCQVRQGQANSGVAGIRIEINWYTSADVLISRTEGNLVDGEPLNKWVQSVATGVAPAGAAYMDIGAWAFRNSGGHSMWIDTFTWNYSFSVADANLVFRAVQADAGFSGPIEPLWPNVNGQQVVDNEVTWEAITSSRVVWEANPILVSGYDEPDWPIEVGGDVSDNTIIWRAISRRVDDEKLPQSPITLIGASKVFKGDKDIIPYSATVNPLDWSTEEDAGYLPFGLQAFGANPVAALGLYRTNLMAFNSEGFQMWQIDEDPANMALLDAAAVGCIWPRTIFPVQNDLVFLSNVGVRNISIAGASTNLQAGTFGEAIDPMVLEKIRAGEYEPFGLFVPGYGQYWLFFGDEAFVLTISDVKKQSWSRYTFPEVITDWTLDGGDLVLRTEDNHVWRFSPEAIYDDEALPGSEAGGDDVSFHGDVWWPFLDFNSIGVEKQFVAIDITATAPEGLTVSIGYDQRDRDGERTDPHDIEADTLPVQALPIPCAGASFDVLLHFFGGGGKWEWNATIISINDMRPGA